MKIDYNRSKLDLLWELVKTSFKLRYQNSILGFLWVLIKPYSIFLVMYVIWTQFGLAGVPNYGLYLLIGIVLYSYTNELIITGQLALIERANIILKVNFPRQIAIISALSNGLINLSINMVLVTIILLVSGIPVEIFDLPAFLFVVVILFTFLLGVSFFLSVATIFFRDLQNIVELGMFLLIWATPIYYPVSILEGGRAKELIMANPFGIMIDQARVSLGIIDGSPDYLLLLAYFIFSLIIAYLGWIFFQGRIKTIAEYF